MIALAPCGEACPLGVPVSDVLALLESDRVTDAMQLLVGHNPFADVCGRLCASPCESSCRRGLVDQPVPFREVEKTLAEIWKNDARSWVHPKLSNEPAVGVFGSGLSAMSAVLSLIQAGIKPTWYADQETLGGWIAKLPAFVMPGSWLQDFRELIRRLKVPTKPLGVLDRAAVQRALRADLAHAILAPEPPMRTVHGLPGDESPQVHHAGKLLQAESFPYLDDLGERVAVVGGSSLAVSMARVARRMGASWVHVYTSGSRLTLTASPAEIEQAHAEGIRFNHFMKPTAVSGSGGKLAKVQLRKLRVEREGGRERLVPDPTRDQELEVSSLILADLASHRPRRMDGGFEEPAILNAWGADDEACHDSEARVWFAARSQRQDEDFPNVVTQLARGRSVAEALVSHIKLAPWRVAVSPPEDLKRPVPLPARVTVKPLVKPDTQRSKLRFETFDDPSRPFTVDKAKDAASLCLRCQFTLDLETSIQDCIGCGLCVDICPTHCLDLVDRETSPAMDMAPLLSKPLLKLIDFRADLNPSTHATQPILAREDQCIRCLRCVDQCPTHAIGLQPVWRS